MKIIYLISHDQNKNLGITLKVESQVNAWRTLGHQVEIFNIIVNNSQSKNNYLNAKIFKRNSIFKGNDDLLTDLDKFKPDIIYLRFEPYKPFLGLIMKKYPTVLEINTDDLHEQLLLSKDSLNWKLRYLFNLLTRKKMLKNSTGYVAVTEELQKNRHFSKYQKISTTSPNSIQTEKFDIIKIENTKNKIPHLYFMGNFNRAWHGVDKIIKLAQLTKNQLFFHIVGGKPRFNVIPSNVKFYGYLNKNEYMNIIKKCNLAIGSLAFHRIPLSEACPLKVREYLAYGLPTIIGYKDTAFLNKKPEWILEIPNSEKNVEKYAEDIVKFCYKWKNYVVQKTESIQYIDSNILEKKKIAFFQEIINNDKS